MHRWVIFLFQVTALLFSLGASPFSAAQVEFSDPRVNYEFQNQMDFEVQVTPAEDIQSVSLSIQPEGGNTILQETTIDKDGMVRSQLELERSPYPERWEQLYLS